MTGRLLPWNQSDAATNMAIDEGILLAYRQGKASPTLRFYGWSPPAVSIGYFQELDKEIDRDACCKHGIQWVRRPTGGRAVLHHQELTYALIMGGKDGLQSSVLQDYLKIAQGISDGLNAFGIRVELHSGRSQSDGRLAAACFASPSWYELKHNGKKLVGSAQLRLQGAILQHGSILTDFDPELLLAVIGRANDRHLYEGMKQRITSCREALSRAVVPTDLIPFLVYGISKALGMEIHPGSLSAEELAIIDDLKRYKYSRTQWNNFRGGSGNK